MSDISKLVRKCGLPLKASSSIVLLGESFFFIYNIKKTATPMVD